MPRRARGATDPLAAADAHRWLVVRDRCSRVIEVKELRAGTDLRRALQSARDGRVSAGWKTTEIRQNCAFFFADRDSDRVCVAIEYYEPAAPSTLMPRRRR